MTAYQFSPYIRDVIVSPVTETQAWIAGREFTDDNPLLNIAQAVPGYPPANELNQHLAGLLHKAETSLYTGIFGMPELRQALAEQMGDEYQSAINAEQVAIVAGCNQAFCVTINALAGPGDEIIVPLPYYFNHQMWLELQGINARHLAFDERTALPDLEQAERLITSKTRALVLVSPNNPTGAVYPSELIAAFYQLAQKHGIALILDETYKDFRIEQNPAHCLFEQADWTDTLIQLYSFSKAYSLTGYRVGSIIASQKLLLQIGKILDCITICAPRIAQEAALFGLRHLSAWRQSKNILMQQRMQALEQAFANPALNYQVVSSGAYFAYVRHPFRDQSAHIVARRLADDFNVLCLPGDTFGPGQESYLRFAFANLDAQFMEPLAQRLIASQA